ncbi:RNA methyltransferase [Methylobacterium ajmalii]|uniref:RNA methyltransferase n=1 Tax=Methylobacterium ajmalii TaxID=2738439 RepID=A0ABV0A326_9HYPH
MTEFPFQRGFAAVGLHLVRTGYNVGGAMRAAHCYGASLVALSGARCDDIRHQTDTPNTWAHMPVLRVDDLRQALPFDCVPVAIDLVEGAVSLSAYQHPRRAFYVFGPENGTLGKEVLSWCRDRVMVPTRGCMNLAATVNVVLYDRVAKAERFARGSRLQAAE